MASLHSSTNSSPSTNSSSKKNACERCRRSKVRCHLETFDQCGKCRRCFDSDTECIFLTPPPRKPRKRTDARVTALERELAQMKGLLGRIHGDDSHSEDSLAARKSVASRASIDTALFEPLLSTSDIIPGCLSTTLLREEEARQLYVRFTEHCLAQFPLVPLTCTSFDHLCVSRPMVLLATITAASAAGDPTLYQNLHAHLVRLITERVLLNGERSLELLESILIMEVWLCPPEDLKLLNFYQWIHIAGTMALQLGLVEDSTELDAAPPVFDEDGVVTEEYRIGLVCYLLSSSAAISLRQQKILSFTPKLATALRGLRSSPRLLDQRLVAWIDLQLIAEQACEASQIASPSSQFPFLEQFATWKDNLEPEVLNASLLMHFEFMRSKFLERGMRLGSAHSKDFVPPYLADKASDAGFQPKHWDMNTAIDFADSCHTLLADFVACGVDGLRSCPTVTFVRALYACQALLVIDGLMAKHGILTRRQRNRTRDGIETVEQHLLTLAGEMQRRVPSKIARLLPHLTNALAVPASRVRQPGQSNFDGAYNHMLFPKSEEETVGSLVPKKDPQVGFEQTEHFNFDLDFSDTSFNTNEVQTQGSMFDFGFPFNGSAEFTGWYAPANWDL